MTTTQKRKILTRIQEVESEISQLKDAKMQLLSGGVQSASISSGSGSKSYTKLDISKLQEAISDLQAELSQLKMLLAGMTSATPKQIIGIYF